MTASERARLLASGGAALVAQLAAAYLFRGSPLAAALGGIVTGVAAGGVLRRASAAAIVPPVAVAAVAAGAALQSAGGDPARVPALLAAGAPSILAGALAASAAGRLASATTRREDRAPALMLAAALGLIVAAMWATGWSAAHRTSVLGPSTVRQLASVPDMTLRRDADLYLRITQLMRDGEGYYAAAMTARQEASPGEPVERGGAVRFRLPTLFWLWSASPLDPAATFVGGLLGLGTLAVLAAFVLGRELAPSPLALASSACVAATFAAAASRTTVTFSEWWSGALVLCAVAAWAAHLSREGDRAWLAAAVSSALAAALGREIAAFVLLGGLAAALLADRRDGRRRWLAWAGALAAFAAAYAAHFALTGGALFGGGLQAGSWLGAPFERVWRVLAEGDRWLPGTPAASVAAAALAVAGLLARRSRNRTLALMLLPAAAFLFAGPSGSLAAGEPVRALGYWGGLVKPTLWAALPAAAGLLGAWRSGTGATPRSGAT